MANRDITPRLPNQLSVIKEENNKRIGRKIPKEIPKIINFSLRSFLSILVPNSIHFTSNISTVMNLTLQKDKKNTILNTWRLRISLFILDYKNKLCCHGTRESIFIPKNIGLMID